MHASGHTPGPPLDSGAKISERHHLDGGIDGDVTPKCTKTGMAEEADNQILDFRFGRYESKMCNTSRALSWQERTCGQLPWKRWGLTKCITIVSHDYRNWKY